MLERSDEYMAKIIFIQNNFGSLKFLKQNILVFRNLRQLGSYLNDLR